MIVTTVQDHHLPPAGHIVQLFGSFHFKSTPEKDSIKAVVTIAVAPICKIRPSCKRVPVSRTAFIDLMCVNCAQIPQEEDFRMRVMCEVLRFCFHFCHFCFSFWSLNAVGLFGAWIFLLIVCFLSRTSYAIDIDDSYGHVVSACICKCRKC
jgi:hypothetical protein